MTIAGSRGAQSGAIRTLCLASVIAAVFGPAFALPVQSGPRPEIARVSSAGYKTRRHCTGFADSRGNLVTSAHCLPRFADDSLHFLFGYDRGRYLSHIEAKAAEFTIDRERDLAIGCGLAPGAAGLIVAKEETIAGTPVVVFGYGVPKSQILQRHDCRVSGPVTAGFLPLGCPQAPGGSGSPVLVERGGGWQVTAVVSASTNTRSRASFLDAAGPDICGQNRPAPPAADR